MCASGRRLTLGVALLIGGTLAGGCGNVGQLNPDCFKQKGSPLALSVQWSAPESYVRSTWSYRHNAIVVGLREPDALSLGIGNPYYGWCETVSEERLRAWIANAEVLRTQLRDPTMVPAQHHEMLVIDFPSPSPDPNVLLVSHAGFVEVDDLDASGLDAALRLSCLARDAFGKRAEGAILELTPTLSSIVGFPSSCSDLESTIPDGS